MPSLSEVDASEFVALARKAIIEAVTRQELPDTIPHHGIFGERRGVFVTVHVRGNLRGCIGTTESDGAVGRGHCTLRGERGIARSTFSADAQRGIERPGDRNFGAFAACANSAGRNRDRHVTDWCLSMKVHRGLLLPQVASNMDCNREEFLAETCRKARLPRDAWHGLDANAGIHLRRVFGPKRAKRRSSG